ncbi:MAG: BACON domain-containing carbohydrate-binding protein [Verrucomicrobiota bacterium]|jgi:DNA-binding beta-propeller fold protein YncE
MKQPIAAILGILTVAVRMHAATYSLGTYAILVGPSAGNSSVVLAVSPATGAWTAVTNASWLHLGPAYASGTGSTNVIFSYDVNPGGTRSGTLTIAGQTLTVTQAGSTYITTQTMNTLVSSGLNQPRGVAVDSSGNVFIADTGNNAVKEWTQTNKTVTTLVSSGLNGPYSVTVDGSENVYIADTGNNAAKEWVAASNTVVPLVTSGLYSPSGVALDPSGNVYIADGHDEVIFEWIAANGSVTNLNIPNPNAICHPPGVAVDIAGNVYFDDTCGDSLQEFTAINGNVSTLQCCWFYNPTGVAVDGQGNVYIADQADNWIWEWSPINNNNTVTTLVSGFNRPGGVAVDGAGNLYIADTLNNAVEEWTQLYLDPTPKVEGLGAGSDALPPVLPIAATQLASSAPTSNQPWLTITGVTNGVVYFAFTATTSTRTGAITLFGQNFPVTQLAGSFALGVNSMAVGPVTGTNSVVLAVYPSTNAWTATANVSWLHLNQSGMGSTNVIFTIDANPGTTRTGTLTIAGQTLVVTQAGSTYVPIQSATTLASGIPYADGDAVDSAGNVYFAVADQNVIKKWSLSNNTANNVVSSGLLYPTDVAVDNAGNLYICDHDDGEIKEWSAASSSLTTLTPTGDTELAADGAGDVYFSNGNAVDVWTAANNTVSTFVSGLAGAASVAVDVAGNLYVNDTAGIQEWNATSGAVTTLATPSLTYGEGMAVDGQGNVYLAGQYLYYDRSYVYKWTAADNTLTALEVSGQAQYFGVTVDAAGNVYFTDAYDGLLQELPNAFLDSTPRTEGLAAGSDSLPAVLPLTINLLAPFAPTSDSAWLTITGATNGVVSYSFTQNLELARTGHINLLGQSIPVTQLGPVFTLGTTALWEGPAAGTDSVVLAVSPNIGIWTATNNVPWLQLSPADSGGTGGTNVIFSFEANPGGPRTGTLTIAGQTLTVTQAGSTYVAANPLSPLVSAGLSLPSGVAVDGAGNVYIADDANHAVKEWILTNNTVTTLVSTGLTHPSGVAVDSMRNVYIADSSNNAIYKWVAASSNLTALVSTGLNSPSGVAVDGAGDVYIADTTNNAVKEWAAASDTVSPLVSSGLNHPSGVAVDAAGNVYIADSGNSVVKEWSAVNTTVTTLVSSGLNRPVGVAVDGAGNVYIADSGNNAIEKWIAASNSVVTLVAAGLNGPQGVAVDGLENLFIADTTNNAVKEMPRAFLVPAAWHETANAGIGALPVVLPAAENLLAPFTPTSDQSWLTITGVTNGVVGFSFTADFGSGRTAHILLLGQSIPIIQNGLTYTLGITALVVGPQTGSNSVVLGVAPTTAAWTATANAAWLHLNAANQGGTGSTNVIFTFDANPGATRAGTLTVGGQMLTVTQAGSAYLSAGSVGILVPSGLSGPFGVAVDGIGNVYIADTIDNAIKEWALTNNSVSTLVSLGLGMPRQMAIDGSGNVYFADSFNDVVDEWLPAENLLTTVVGSGLNLPYGAAVDGAGNVYIADTYHSAIKEWVAANNSVVTLISSGLSIPAAVAVDGAGNVYIADTSHNAIKKWAAANSSVTTLVASGLSSPESLAVDGAGDVYIADSSHNAVKKWSAAGNSVSTLVASGLSDPFGVAVDGMGNVYIADSGNNMIKELPYAFVEPTNLLEGLAAGTDALPAVVPSTVNLLAPFAPTSDQPWLTILGVTKGIVSFGFSANSGPARTAHIQLLGQTNSITQGLIGTPPTLTGIQIFANGAIQFSFTNNPSASFTVLSTTNLSLPLPNWNVVGSATNVSANVFQFTSSPTTGDQQRYYTVRSP